MFWPDTISKRFNIKYPVIQAPMFGVSTPQMTAAAAKAGALGSLALADLSPEKSIELIRETKKLTDQPFAANIFVHNIPEITDSLKERFIKAKQFITQLAKENNIEVTPSFPSPPRAFLNAEKPPVASASESSKYVSVSFPDSTPPC